MASAILTFCALLLVSVYGAGVDSAHMRCESDPQCPDGFFCYEESHYCALCLDCLSYKRSTPPWRSCPKTPTDCGTCISGYQEEILHEGLTRDICIPLPPSNLSLTTDANTSHAERYFWLLTVTALLVPIVLCGTYIFRRTTWQRDRGTMNRCLPHEEPPPYRSIELTTLTSNSEERLAEEDHVVLTVGQQKDRLVQAVPFRQPDYAGELLAFDNNQEQNSDAESIPEDRVRTALPNMELHDDNTMPSDWTPADESESNEQLLTFESGGLESVSDKEDDTCEPASKRYKTSHTPDTSDPSNTHFNINLFINNNVTINKPT